MSGSCVRVLGINASARKYGNTYKLLKIALDAARSEGAETELLHLYDYRLSPCDACLCDNQKACRPPCVENDGAWEVLRKVLRSDALIIATPVYWYAPSGHLKNFIDKLTVFENMILVEGRSWLEGKVAGLIACGAEAGAVMAIAYLMVVLNSMGVHIPPWALAYYEGLGDALECEESVLDAANVGRVVVKAAVILRDAGVWYDPKIMERLGGMERAVRAVREAAKRNEKMQSEVRDRLIRKMLSKDYSRFRV